LPSYEAHLREQVAGLLDWLQKRGISLSQKEVLKYVNPGAAMGLFASILTDLGGVLTNSFLIVLTVVFILLEVTGFPLKLKAALGDEETSSESLSEIAGSIKHYMTIKTLTSFATGASVTVWLAIIGVDYPLLWGLVAFLLNYVPNIGSIIAAIPAVLLTFIQFGMIKALLAILGYTVINLLVGNVIEPRVMGRSMGLSTLVVFISLVFWGWVLGPVGMLLSVPLTMIVKISLEHDEGTKSIAILLGSNPSG
jgi:predicted PurR-regulated permease PerM